MSEFKKCTICKGTGFKNRPRTIICSTCHGSGTSKQRQRGHHEGHVTKERSGGNKFLCPAGHLKTGVSVDKDGNLYPYCEICHREVVRRTEKNKREYAR